MAERTRHLRRAAVVFAHVLSLSSNLMFRGAYAGDMFCDLTGPCASEGPHHKLHLTVTGNVFGIGRNNFGQLGDGMTSYATEPVLAQTESPVSYVSTGGWHSLFLCRDGTARSAGRNDAGQLADGTTLTRSFPRRVMINVKAISAGYYHSLFLTNDLVAYSAGSNEFGQLGIGEYGLLRSSPVLVLGEVVAFSAGECHSLFVRTDGAVWGAGCNNFGQLGDGTTIMRPSPSLTIIDGVTIVYTGSSKSLFIRDDETVWASGQADDRYRHLPGPDWPRSTPAQVATNFSELDIGLNVVLGNTVFATDNRFPPSDPLYETELPRLVGLGWDNWHPAAVFGF